MRQDLAEQLWFYQKTEWAMWKVFEEAVGTTELLFSMAGNWSSGSFLYSVIHWLKFMPKDAFSLNFKFVFPSPPVTLCEA